MSTENLNLEQYVKKINQFLKDNPDKGKLPVVSAIDDEGNGFNFIYFDPSHATYNINGEDVEAVCVN